MPLTLAIEGSGSFLSLACRDGGSGEIRSRRIRLQNNLCESIIDEIDALICGRQGEIREILAGDGPGSFTSLRLVFSVAKGLSAALGAPVRRMSVLALLSHAVFDRAASYGISSDTLAVPVTDARKGRLYCAAYADGGSRQLMGFSDLTLEELKSKIVALRLAGRTDSGGSNHAPDSSGIAFVSDQDASSLPGGGESAFRSLSDGSNARLIVCDSNLAEVLIRHRDECSLLERSQGPTYVRLSDAQENLARKRMMKR